MSLVIALFNHEKAALASDGHAVRYDDDGTPHIARTDCCKVFRTKSGQLVGRVGQHHLCVALEYKFRDFNGSLEELADKVEQFIQAVEPAERPAKKSTIGTISALLIGRAANGKITKIGIARDDDETKRNMHDCDPGFVGFCAIGFTRLTGDLLDELTELTPNVRPENYANFCRYALQRVNEAFPVEVGGDFFAEELEGASHQVMDGQNHVRLAASHAAANVAYNFQGAWNSITNYVIGDEVTLSNIYWIAVANNTNSQPSSSNANWQAVGRIQGDVQIFTASGTWSKPAAGTFAIITCIGGGSGGSGGGKSTVGNGGFAGGISVQTLPLSILGSTESVTIGTGGGGGAGSFAATSNPGGSGGQTSFGNWLRAGGGTSSAAGGGNMDNGTFSMQGGNGGNGGTGGGNGNAGASGATARTTPFAGGSGGTGAINLSGAATAGNGGTGTAASTDEPAGGGGGGGGGSASTGSSGGTATAGAGGNGGNYGAAGGGGGLAASTGSAIGGAGGNGSAGILVIAVY